MIMIQEAKRLDTKGMLKNDIKQGGHDQEPARCAARPQLRVLSSSQRSRRR